MDHVPPGWPGFISGADALRGLPVRGGLYDNPAVIAGLSEQPVPGIGPPSPGSQPPDWYRGFPPIGGALKAFGAAATDLPTADADEASPFMGLGAVGHPVHAARALSVKRPETPLLAYVDRSAFPGLIPHEEYEGHVQQAAREWEHAQVSTWQGATAAREAAAAAVAARPDFAAAQPQQAPVDDWEAELLAWKRKYGCPDAEPSTPAGVGEQSPSKVGTQRLEAEQEPAPIPAARQRSAASVAGAPSGGTTFHGTSFLSFAARDSVLDMDISEAEMRHGKSLLPVNGLSSLTGISFNFEGQPEEARGLSAYDEGAEDGEATALGFEATATPASPSLFRTSTVAEATQWAPSTDATLGAKLGQGDAAEPVTPALTVLVPLDPEPQVPRPDSRKEAADPKPGGRYAEYTQADLHEATTTALARLGPGGSWKSGYSEAEIQKRDFFMDLRKQRDKDKGKQASGPIWTHLAMQAKCLASTLDLSELLEALKLFCSVRYEDYELYMRLLGEVPHYVRTANADQLCELIRLLARRRLRERNYVDMVAAQMLQKIRLTDDHLPARLLVKTANAFAALECRSQPKFVEHFLRHLEHRVEELDAELCCEVSPLFVANYMCDALRRAYLKRCAETQAGFQGPDYELRNLACTELVLRKEHHSFLASVPAYVGRYLEKVRQHALFDKWGSVALPAAVAPDGPKGSHRTDMSVSLQHKASTATGGARGDVFSSDMHRDVSACLTHLGIEHENGVLCGPYLIDVVALDMVTPTRRIVYEVNSPHHYYEGTQTLTAEKRLRHRMLGRLGQKLHMVNAEDWRPLTAAQKMTFILKLQQAQQEENAKEAKQQAAANALRAPLPSLRPEASRKPEPFKLKSIRDLNAPIRVPVPPSLRGQGPLTAR